MRSSIFLSFLLTCAIFIPSVCKADIEKPVPAKIKLKAVLVSLPGETPERWRINNTEYIAIEGNYKWISILYKDRDYDKLTKHILKAVKSKDERETNTLKNLYTILGDADSDEQAALRGEILREWCDKAPDSHIPWLIRGVFQTSEAWRVRGCDVARKVDPLAWPVFRTKLKLAQKLLEKSLALNPADPNSSARLLVLCYGRSLPKKTMEKYFAIGAKHCPWHSGLYAAKLQYLEPKWGGNAAERDKFAVQCFPLVDKYLYLGNIKTEFIVRQVKARDPEVKNAYGSKPVWEHTVKDYERTFEKYPEDLRPHTFYAGAALWAGKNEIANNQFTIIGNHWFKDGRYGSLESHHKYRAKAMQRYGLDKINEIGNKRLDIRGFKKAQQIIELCEKAIELYPHSRAYSVMGRAQWIGAYFLMSATRLRKARASFLEAIRLDPEDEWAQSLLRDIERQCKNHLNLEEK